jgi:hypothetical protein
MVRSNPIRVSRAPVLTLWAAVVAERLGYPRDCALTLGRAVAGFYDRSTMGRFEATEKQRLAAPLRHKRATIRLLDTDVPVVVAEDGMMFAKVDGRPAQADGVRFYLIHAFGGRLAEVRAAMERLAMSLPPGDLNRAAVALYLRFRPEKSTTPGTGSARGELRLELIIEG